MLQSFFDLLFPPRESELIVRLSYGLDHFLRPETRLLSSCEILTLLSYQEPDVRACILEAKFHGNEMAAKLLGEVLRTYLFEELIEINLYEQRSCILIPVPLSHARLRERGYNQAETIARYALCPEVAIGNDLVIRIRDTLPQTTLDGRERRENVRGAFGAAWLPDPSAAYFVIDDVVTTGATMGEVIRTLYDAGAKDVCGIALAH